MSASAFTILEHWLTDLYVLSTVLLLAGLTLPDQFAANEPDDRLESALAHEKAHIQNGDLRWLALLRLLNVVLYAQPLFWWLAARFVLTRNCSPTPRLRCSTATAAWRMPKRWSVGAIVTSTTTWRSGVRGTGALGAAINARSARASAT